MRALEQRTLPAPIDALNLVHLADEVSYRWYGLLLAPVLIPAGARPVWAGMHDRALHGEQQADEIVIVRYPHHRLLLRAITSRYYAWVNRWRERGVRAFEFSLTQRVHGEPRIGRGEHVFFVHYNDRGSDPAEALENVRDVLEAGPARLVYASREVSPLSIFRWYEPSDPNPASHGRTAAFEVADVDALTRFVDADVVERLETVVSEDLSLQVYRRLGYSEALPWARRTR